MMFDCIEENNAISMTRKKWSRADSTNTQAGNFDDAVHDKKQFLIITKSPTKPNEIDKYSMFVGQYIGTGEVVTTETIRLRAFPNLNLDDLQIKSPVDQLNDLKLSMGLNLCDISSILGVSRQAIYGWLEGVSIRHQYQEKLNNLTKISDYWSRKNVGQLGSYLRHQIIQFDSSLFDLLQKENVDVTTIYQILNVIENKLISKNVRLKERKDKFREHGFDDIVETKRDENLGKLTRKIS